METDQKFWFKWMLNYSFGELLAIGAAAIIGRLLFINISSMPLTHTLTICILVIAGAAEGLIIGYIQWRSLSQVLLHFKATPWVVSTMLSAIAGWLLILPPSIMLISFLARFSMLSDSYSILYAAFVGISFGALMGVPQFFLIRKFYSHAFVWILANCVAWMFSFLIIYSALAMFRETSGIYNLSLVILSCILSGSIQGIVTGTSLHFLMSVKKIHRRNPDDKQFPFSVKLE